MPQLISPGSVLSCSFGSEPMPMQILPRNPVLSEKQPIATIFDVAPLLNIPSFGMCTSPANPSVTAATAAALGVLTPMPCVPATRSPWFPGALEVLLDGKPALCSGSRCLCDWLGQISIEPGQDSVLTTSA